MESKALLKSFWQLINVLRISVPQTIGILLISYAAGQLALVYGVRGCVPFSEKTNLYFWFFGFVGVVSTTISIYYILFPAVWMQNIDRQLLFSATDVNVPFFSTQPVYVFLDAVYLIPAIALFQSGRAETMCQYNFEWAFGWTFLLMTIFFPVMRTVSWFFLKRRIEAKRVRVPWTTLIMWWLFAIPLASYLTLMYLNGQVYPRLRVPVVNEFTFKGGLRENPEFTSGIVRVQGILVRDIAKCGLIGKDPAKTPYPSGTILLDMGERNGQIMVKANRPSLVKILENESQNKKGKIFEAFGRLSPLPNPEKKLVCGIGKVDTAQTGGVALLEIEVP